MRPPVVQNDDLEAFANYLGLSGTDVDVFYESYYHLNSDDYDYDDLIDEYIR